MASLEKDEKAVETTRQLFPVDSNASRRSSYFVEEDGLHYYSHPHHQTLFSSLLSILGSHQQDRRRCSYASVAGIEDAPPPFQFAESKPSISRRAMFLSILKRACIIVPVITLAIFGFLHLVQVGVSGAALIWDFDPDDFLPNWGKPGYFGSGLADYPTDATRDVLPIPVHSHNDYWRRIPLFEALHYGCTGVEADVWLFDEELYVGHNTAALTPNRTFRSLYVDPITTLLDKQNPSTTFGNTSRHGVFDTEPSQTLTLLVDLKTDGASTFPLVQAQLEPLRSRGYLTYFNGTHTIPGAVTVVGTGNTPFDMLTANTTYRDIFFDAPLDRLWEMPSSQKALAPETSSTDTSVSSSSSFSRRDGGQGATGLTTTDPDVFDSSTSYYASVSFRAAVGYVWRGHLSSRQIEAIRGQIRGAKRRGLKARYWDTPAWPIGLRNHVWHVLVSEGADMLNADDLRSASRADWRRWRHEWW